MGLGDEVLVTGQCRVLQQTDPRKVRVIYEKPRWFDVWDNNPRIARQDEEGDFQELRPRAHYLRSYMAAKNKERWTWQPYAAPKGEIYFTESEIAFGNLYANRLILEPHIKSGASPNKDWGWMRWQKLAWLLYRHGIKVTQFGNLSTPLLECAELIETPSFRLACAVLATSRACVVPEGGLHHAAAAVGARAIVIYGGYVSPRVTGYSDQVSLFIGEDLGCGMRVKCGHCQKAMEAITPQTVTDCVQRIL